MKNNNIHHYIYEFLNLIPKNKLISYKTLWQIFWLHPRTVAKILSENNETEKYPCYKVIYSNWEIWWYNKWIEEKISKLESDWFIIEKSSEKIKVIWIDRNNNFFRKPILFNFFVAFPLEWEDLKKFKNLIFYLKKINNWSFTLQKEDTPHITLRFFWDLDFKSFQNIVYKTSKNIKRINTSLKNQIITFNEIDNFWERVRFYRPKSENIIKELKKFYIQYHKVIWIPKEKRSYHPHLTIARIKDEKKFQEIKKDFINIIKNFKFNLKINKLRFYAAVDYNFQIPLIDILLTPELSF